MAKKAVKKAVKKPVKRAAKSVKRVAKPAPKKVIKRPQKTVKKAPVKKTAKPLAQMPPAHADQLQKLLTESNVPPAQLELPRHEEPKLLPVTETAVPTFTLTVKIKKFFFIVRNADISLVQNDKVLDHQMSDGNGRVEFKTVAAGDYVLSTTVDGKIQTKIIKVSGDDKVTFRV